MLTPLNIELAVLTAVNYDYSIHPDLPFCSALATAYNATLMEDFVEKDDAFFGTLRINFNDPETAVHDSKSLKYTSRSPIKPRPPIKYLSSLC